MSAAASEARPLSGKRIALTRPRDQAGTFASQVSALGGSPLVLPAIQVVPPDSYDALDAALSHLDAFDWLVCTSVNAVRVVRERASVVGLSIAESRTRIAAVGRATASELARGVRMPDFVSSGVGAEQLAADLPNVAGKRVLFPHARDARAELPAVLRTRGARVDECVAYDTRRGDGVDELARLWKAGEIDAVLFASPSAVKFVHEAVGSGRSPAVFCIGDTTRAAAESLGWRVAGIPPRATQPELLHFVATWFAPGDR